jgi:hypothetical protein
MTNPVADAISNGRQLIVCMDIVGEDGKPRAKEQFAYLKYKFSIPVVSDTQGPVILYFLKVKYSPQNYLEDTLLFWLHFLIRNDK